MLKPNACCIAWQQDALDVNSNKTKSIRFKQIGAIYTLNDKSLKLVDHFSFIVSNISSMREKGTDYNQHVIDHTEI